MHPNAPRALPRLSPGPRPNRQLPPGARRLAVLVAAVLAAGSSVAQVSTKFGIGDWHDPLLWSTGQVPFASTGALLVSDTTVSKAAVARLVALDAALTIGGDEGRLTVGNAVRLGTGYDTEGTLHINGQGQMLLQASSLSVGAVNRGTVRVQRGSIWLTGPLLVGSSFGVNPANLPNHSAYGLVEIRGAESAVSAGALALGSFATSATRVGVGELLVAQGARLRSSSGAVANGQLTVQGVGSGWLLWRNPNDSHSDGLSVEGRLTVRNGGAVGFDHSTGQVWVYGEESRGTQGALTVTGDGSRLIVPTGIMLGRPNSIGGTMTVSEGGFVRSGSAIIEDKGAAQVLGAASFWQIDGLLSLQNYQHASFMTIANGAGVGADSVRIGRNNGAVNRQAMLTVSDAGSRLLVANQLTVGRDAQSGLLQVLAGAQVDSGSAIVGENFRARGDATVDGAGSHWRVGGVLTLGAMGVGVAQLSNGGLLTAGSMNLGRTVHPSIRDQVGGSLVIGGSILAEAPGNLAVSNAIRIQQTGRIVFNHTGNGHRFETVVVSAALGEGLIDHRAGTTILDADLSLFTGDTQVNGGTLLVDGVLGSPLVTVAAGATLGGSGVLLGDVLAQPGAVVNPGNSPGRLVIDGDLALQQDARLVLEIAGGTAGSQHDQLQVGGDLQLALGTLELAFVGQFAPAAGQRFSLLQVGGSFSSAAAVVVSGLLPDWQFSTSFDHATGGFSLLSLSNGVSTSPVPMPASQWLLAMGLAALAWRRCRRWPTMRGDAFRFQ